VTTTLIRSKPKRKTEVITPSLVLSIFGPPGSTGKSSLALNLAYEFAEQGKSVLLVDLDTYSPSLAHQLGVTDPPAALAGCARLIRQGRFDREQLNRLSVHVKHRRAEFRALTGLATSRRWPEINEETVTQLLLLARQEFDLIILDVASHLEPSLTSANHPTERNIVTRTALAQADIALNVLGESSLSLSRHLNHFTELQELQPNQLIVLNRSSVKPAVITALKTLTKQTVFATIPDDQPAFQLAESQHLPLALARRKSPARNAIALLSHKLLECPPSVN
jgi:MinD-like ATPase involved in chromosome partitioning or flagellar assembly